MGQLASVPWGAPCQASHSSLPAVCLGGALRLIVNGKAHVVRGSGKPVQHTVRIPGNRVRSLAFEVLAGGGEPGHGAAGS